MNKFNPSKVAESTAKNAASVFYGSWLNLARYLDKVGYNEWEAEAILNSDIPEKAVMEYGFPKSKNSHCHTKWHIRTYLTAHGMTPRSPKINALVLKANPDLVANGNGVPCRSGRMPGNPEAGSILVPVGTPLICDPTSETYWSS